MPETISLHEMKKHQARVVARIKRGEILTLTERGQPVVLMSPATTKQAPPWDELMAPVYQAASAAQKRGARPHVNPVLAERARRRR